MTYEQKQEAIKTMVFGGSNTDAAESAGCSIADLDEITFEEIEEVKADLKEMGWTE